MSEPTDPRPLDWTPAVEFEERLRARKAPRELEIGEGLGDNNGTIENMGGDGGGFSASDTLDGYVTIEGIGYAATAYVSLGAPVT